ncbi:MAG TPA: tetratricopeptide repeat protein [Thermodesulfovibrionales bacterium]|jgi:tetratricopeptide (TPR) repeat protein|nr:tetratricopeptide repeat protein [Thermodesulfovibrionales bacterium]
MGKLFLFYIAYLLTGSPITALLVLLLVFFAVDRAYLGLVPDPLKTLKTSARIRELKQAVSINPHDGRSLKELGICMIDRGDYQNALRYFAMAETKMSDDPEFNYYHGIAAARTGNIDKGRVLFEEAVNASPTLKYGEPYLMMAEVYIDNGDYTSAVRLLEKFEKIHSSSSRGFYRMGLVKLKLGAKDEGREYLEKAIRVFKESPFFKRKIDRKWAWKARMLLRASG